jgi:hypothetical protein
MGIISTLFNGNRVGPFKAIRQFVTFSGQGDNALVTTKEANAIGDAVNVLAKNAGQIVSTHFAVSSVGGPEVVTFPAARGMAASGGPWDICEGNGTDCGSATNPVYKKMNASIAEFHSIGPGIYTVNLSLDAADDARFAQTSIHFGNLPVAGFISVVKTSKFGYTVTTYNAAGIATPNLLTNTLLVVNWYPSKLTDEFLQI